MNRRINASIFMNESSGIGRINRSVWKRESLPRPGKAPDFFRPGYGKNA